MTQEKKQLLLKDLCSRLPYGVKIMFSHNGFRWDWEQTLTEITKCDDGEYAVNGWGIHGIKPYLRPMSNMTEKEGVEYFGNRMTPWTQNEFGESYTEAVMQYRIDFLLEHHLDYCGLIEKGLALEAPEGMYKF